MNIAYLLYGFMFGLATTPWVRQVEPMYLTTLNIAALIQSGILLSGCIATARLLLLSPEELDTVVSVEERRAAFTDQSGRVLPAMVWLAVSFSLVYYGLSGASWYMSVLLAFLILHRAVVKKFS
jgi:hypothetical protein